MGKQNIKIKAEAISLQTLLDNIQIVSFSKEYDDERDVYIYKVNYKMLGTLTGCIEKEGNRGSITYENCQNAVVEAIKLNISNYLNLSLK